MNLINTNFVESSDLSWRFAHSVQEAMNKGWTEDTALKDAGNFWQTVRVGDLFYRSSDVVIVLIRDTSQILFHPVEQVDEEESRMAQRLLDQLSEIGDMCRDLGEIVEIVESEALSIRSTAMSLDALRDFEVVLNSGSGRVTLLNLTQKATQNVTDGIKRHLSDLSKTLKGVVSL